MTSDSTPAFEIEKEALKTEIETGIQAGVDHLEAKTAKRKDADKYHNTRHLLKQYRKVAYAIQISEADMNVRMEMEHGTRLSTLEVNAELAGVDLSGSKLEGYARTVIRSKNMLQIIDNALNTVRMDPDHGELMYQVLYLTYFSKKKPANREVILAELDRQGFPMSMVTYAAAVKSLLLARGFGITSIHQIVIGSTMSVAQRLCHGAKPFGNKYFVVSTFFAQCLFLTNNKEGDTLLKLILHDELAMEINHAALSPFHPPRIPTREYDAIETSLDRPVLLNYQCDLLMLSDIHPMPEGFRGSPIMLCFDYQTQVIQRIVGPAIEVRPLESRLDYG